MSAKDCAIAYEIRERLELPTAILHQNARSRFRRIGGRPGDRIAGQPLCVTIHPG
jgi:hypothetical protein